MTGRRSLRALLSAALLLGGMSLAGVTSPRVEASSGYQRISGEGSSWAANALDAMRVNVRQFGITVDYNPSGSTAGRKNFLNGTVDFAASDIPFQFRPEDGSAPENPARGSYAYMPITAGGTAFMYNLIINGKRVTNLRLSGENVVKLFTGKITQWNDPAIAADNPGLVLPARKVVPVVRSDGSGSTAQFTRWMISQHGALWNDYCKRSGRAPACGQTSFYPTIPGMIAQSGDLGVSGYVSQGFAEGAIGYVNYSYALGAQFPVAKLLNRAGFYTEPTPQNVAVSLLKAQIDTNEANPETYLTQKLDGVYADTDPRNYPLSSYSYLILPTKVAGQFNEAKGKTLGAFAYYAMCQAQQQSASLGYSPMPANLVLASFDQIKKIPGVVVQNIDIKQCKNPTFSPDGTNLLAKNAPQPLACDKKGGTTQCPNGTGGLANVQTAVKPGAATGGGNAGGGNAGGGNAGGGNSGGGSAGGGGNAGGGDSGGGTIDTLAPGDTLPPGDTIAPGDTVPGGDGSGVIDNGGGDCVVDPDTGQCVQSGGPDPESAVGPDVAGATPTTLGLSSSLGTSFALVALVILLVLALVLGPALAWRHFSRRGAS